MRHFLLITSIIFSNIIFAQNEIIVHAKVVDENNNPVPFADIAFRRLQLGFSSGKDGDFTTKMLRSDSLLILKRGHTPTKLIFKDSIPKKEYNITIVLPRTPQELTEVQISAIRTHQQIRQEINQLYVKETDVNPGARPMLNPLSYLYELFSKREKEKRFTAQLEAEEAKRIVLKDLFRLYNNYNIIDLDEDEYDRFITYLNMPYEYLQHTSDYDLAVSIKRLYAGYSKEGGSSFRKQIYPAALDDMERVKQTPKEDR
ncbi:MAG: hypothetical protein JWN78_3237 [Bacteroidota bacterium]|nr:hypothetical protein [Bacteroidota bacterium]